MRVKKTPVRIPLWVERIITGTILCIITPGVFLFEMLVVLPESLELDNKGMLLYTFHLFWSTACIINLVGNYVFSAMVDSKVRKSCKEGVYCDICKLKRPADSWHCTSCNACIVRRGHHCTFISSCVGLGNQRYYIYFTFHLMLFMAYLLYFNFYYVSSMFKEYEMLGSALRTLNIGAGYMRLLTMELRDVLALMLLLNFYMVIWAACLFVTQMRNVVRGVTEFESKTRRGDLRKWRENIELTFGRRWTLSAVFPFVESPLPEKIEN